MRNMIVLSAIGSVLAIGLGGVNMVAAEPDSSPGLVHKVQSGGDKAPGARGQEGGGKGAAPSGREPGGGLGGGQGKGGDRGARPEKGAGADKGAGPDKADRGTQMRSGEKGTRDRQGSGRADVDVRGGRGDRTRVDRRTGVDVNVDRGRRAGGRDVDVNIRGYGYGPSTGGVNCQDIIRRYRQCVRR
jgi:hypothetical protein